ncbi:MAG TPA: ERF family protein [Burkholderiaceae bacterium]
MNHLQNAVSEVTAMPLAPAASNITTPADIVRYAIDKGASLDAIEKLMELQVKFEANEARKQYVADMAEFKRNPPTIVKDHQVSFGTGSGKTQYMHATIGNVTGKIIASLAQHGFSHSWNTAQRDGRISVTCTITHRLGHSESVMLESSPDKSGGKNDIQAIVSAQTYLQRHTLLAATGLATHDQADDDGQAAGLDTTLADKWLARVNATQKPDDLTGLLEQAWPELETANDLRAYSELRAAVTERRSVLAAAQAPRSTYSDESFQSNRAAWRQIVETGRKTPEDLIAFIESKAALTDLQKNEILTWKAA